MSEHPADRTWDEHAGWWQDEFTAGADPEYEEQILPLAASEFAAGSRVLDVGCGEGQVARRMAAAGAVVTGVDPSPRQIEVARARGGGPTYLEAPAERLPFEDASFDGVLVCLALEHIADIDPVVAEMARVLAPTGRLVLYLNHPLFQTRGSGWVDDHLCDPPERYWRVGPYLRAESFVDEVAKGVFIRFHHRPLSHYVAALAGQGLAVVALEEPPPPPGFVDRAHEYEEAADYPRLLVLRAEPHGS